jgi:hypothetical protein
MAVDRRKVTPLEEDMGAREILRSAADPGGWPRTHSQSGPYLLSGAMIRVNSPVANSTPTTIGAPPIPAIQA